MATSPSPFVQGQNLPSDPYSAYKYHNNQRALQAALVQSTNQGLLNIRNAELNYYAAFYLTFGGQATLIGGFLYTGINQIHFPDNIQYTDDVYHYLQLAFWLRLAYRLLLDIALLTLSLLAVLQYVLELVCTAFLCPYSFKCLDPVLDCMVLSAPWHEQVRSMSYRFSMAIMSIMSF